MSKVCNGKKLVPRSNLHFLIVSGDTSKILEEKVTLVTDDIWHF